MSKQKTLIDDTPPATDGQTEADARPRRKVNPTVRAIQAVLAILDPLDAERRRRVLACVLDELGVRVCRAVPMEPAAPAWKPGVTDATFEPRVNRAPEERVVETGPGPGRE